YLSYETSGFYPYADSFSLDYDVGYYNVPYYADVYNLQDSNETLEKEDNYERKYSLSKEEVFLKNDDCNSLYEENQEMRKKLEEREREIERYEKMFTDSRKNEVRLDNINKELKKRVKELREENAQMKKNLVYEKRISDNLRNECVRKEELIVRLQQARRSTYHPKDRKQDYDKIVDENKKLKREIFFFKETNMGLIEGNKRRKISYNSDNESE
ncbi:27980_t:CDS:1, partial [Dentiscutata erythropus]